MSNTTITPVIPPLGEEIAEILTASGQDGFVNLLEFYQYFDFIERNFLREDNERNVKIKAANKLITEIGNVWLKRLV